MDTRNDQSAEGQVKPGQLTEYRWIMQKDWNCFLVRQKLEKFLGNAVTCIFLMLLISGNSYLQLRSSRVFCSLYIDLSKRGTTRHPPSHHSVQ